MEIENNLQEVILKEAAHVCEEKEIADISAEETIEKEVDISNSGTVCEEVPKPEMVLALEDEFDTEFRENEANYYSDVSITAEGVEQKYIILIDKNKKADMPIKVIPLIPSGRQIMRYKDEINAFCAKLYSVSNDKDNPGEIYLSTLRMNRIVDKYRQGDLLTTAEIKDYVQEIADWTTKMTFYRERAIKKIQMKESQKRLREYDYANGVSKRCTKVVISDKAYASMVAESLSRDPLETGGILLGHYKDGIWYVVESTDPGLNTSHTTVHHEMDQQYHNHIYPVISRLYEKDLLLLGLWHRHPGSFNKFSADDNRTNSEYAKVIENGALSFLINLAPETLLTCYYLDYCDTGAYFQPQVEIGDKYFEGTDFLKVASTDTLFKRRKQMKTELMDSVI